MAQNYSTPTQDLPIHKIRLGVRHPKAMGHLQGLARSIQQEGLLQPIGLTEGMQLVIGEGRLRAVQDILHWKSNFARPVNISSAIVAGEYTENEIRKDFTVSQRLALAKTLEEQ